MVDRCEECISSWKPRYIYIEQPRGFESKGHPNYVCKLKKLLYGPKQSPRSWYEKIAEFMLKNRYCVTPDELSLFMKVHNNLSIILVYVDDLIIIGDEIVELKRTRENLSIRFQMKAFGELEHFLGLEISYTKDGLLLCQQKYAREIL